MVSPADPRLSVLSGLLGRRSTLFPSGQSSVGAEFKINIPVFVYGSLLVPEVLRDALGVDEQSTPHYESATLHNYSRRTVTGASFPAIVPHQGECVSGCLISLKTAKEAAALDAMERVLYTRREVQVKVGHEERCAYAYIWSGREDELSSDLWDVNTYIKSNCHG